MQLGVSCLHLLEQSSVLDRDDSLVGEGFQEFNLLFREGQQLGTTQKKATDGLPLAQQRETQHGALVEAHRNVLPKRKFPTLALGAEIVHVNRHSVHD